MVHQKNKPGHKPVFGTCNSCDCFVDSQAIRHRHRAVSLHHAMEPTAAAIFAGAWTADFLLCTEVNPTGAKIGQEALAAF